MDWLFLTNIVLNFIVIIVHIIALRLLLSVDENNVRGTQKLLLIALCVTELVFTILDIGTKAFYLMGINLIPRVCWMLSVTSGIIMYIFIMIMITVDRLLEIYLNIKYHLYWCVKKTKWVLTTVLVTSLLLGIPAVIVGLNDPCQIVEILSLYVYPPLEVIFIIIASCTYVYIFKQIQRHKKVSNRTERQLSGNSTVTYRRSSSNRFRIFVPTLIIITFIFFTIGPNIIKLCFFIGIIKTDDEVHIAYLFIPIGFIADPLIYILNIKSVRRRLQRIIRRTTSVHTASSV